MMRRGVVFDPIGKPISQHCPSAWNWLVDINLNEYLPKSSAVEGIGGGDTEDIPNAASHNITMSIPVHRTVDEIGDINVSALLRIFGESTMRIYNAILSGQRILFVGYSHAAADVAQMVFSAAALVTPPLVGVCRRLFPYGNLTDLSFLEVIQIVVYNSYEN